MANQTLNSRLLIRNDTAANWQSGNQILMKGELGIEIDTKKIKIGDGTTAWNALGYASGSAAVSKDTVPSNSDSGYDIGTIWVNTSTDKVYVLTDNTPSASIWKQMVTPDELSELGAGDMLKSQFATNEKAAQGYVDKAITADTVTGSIESSQITGLGTAATKDVGTSSGNIPALGEDGKLDSSILPAIAITDTFEADSESAMLALSAQKGDICVRSDENKTYILKQEPATEAENWVELATPTDAVLSVNGETGAVTLNTDKISEGSTNLYYTEERAATSFETNFASMITEDVFILDGGDAAGHA